MAFTFLAVGAYEAAISYFHYVCEVKINAPKRQNYILVDRDLWEHSSAGLSDIRLYDGETPVPYALREQSGGVASLEQNAKILNLGTVAGQTEFDIDASGLDEYDRIRLRLSARNFVATAQISGKKAANDAHSVRIGESTLYDFAKEKLGSSSLLQIPSSSFPFLHVRLSPGIKPAQVEGAAISNIQERIAQWVPAGTCQAGTAPSGLQAEYVGHNASWYLCALSNAVPVDRLVFRVNAGQVNFRRDVSVFSWNEQPDKSKHNNNTASEAEIILNGDIGRIKTVREGKSIVSENLALTLPEVRTKQLAIKIDNGDDVPLSVTVQPYSIARRIYFDPAGKTTVTLYSGDDKLGPPTYDYAKFFHEDPSAVEAQMGESKVNPQFAVRPDDRPWSEQHKAIMWVAMLLAVAVLAGLAIRGFTTEARGKA